jgi:hypothetical protein
MTNPGGLASVGLVLLVAQFLIGGALNRVTNDSPFVMTPLVLGVVCLGAAFVWGLIKGPMAIRLAVLLGFGSFVSFGYGVLVIYGDTYLFLALSAALFILAVTVGISASRSERATAHASSASK